MPFDIDPRFVPSNEPAPAAPAAVPVAPPPPPVENDQVVVDTGE